MSDPSETTNTPNKPAVSDLESILNDPLRVSEGELPSIIGVGGQATHTNTNEDLDDAGQPFDPAIHEASRRKNVKGEWARKRGRKTGSPAPQMRVGGQGTGPGAAPIGPTLPAPIQYQSEAAAAVGLLTAGHATLLGEHWLPDPKSGEFPTMVETVRQAMVASGQQIVLPWWAPIMGMYATYAIPRFPHPTTRTRVAGIVGAVRGWWSKTFKRSKKAMGAKEGQETDGGKNAVDRTSATVTSSVSAGERPFWADTQKPN